jgi:hypothetical protein
LNCRTTVYERARFTPIYANPNDFSTQAAPPVSDPKLHHADSRATPPPPRPDFPDAILISLLRAQVLWLAHHDPATVRRELIALLATLG